MSLTSQEVRFFRESGYLLVPGILGASAASRLGDMIDEDFATPEASVEVNSDGKVYRLSRAYERRPDYAGAARSVELLDAISRILGPDIVLRLNRHNHITRNVGRTKPQRLHRDILHWSRSVLTAMIYVDDTTPANGATRIVPCSHRLPMGEVSNNGGTWLDSFPDLASLEIQSVAVPAPAGSALLFDSLAFHAAGTNYTDTSERRAFSFAYHAIDELDSRGPDAESVIVAGGWRYKGGRK